MLTPRMLGRLRATQAWPRLRAAHQRIAPPICDVIHRTIMYVGVERLPADLALKHIYDYQVVWIDPRLLERSLRVGQWARAPRDDADTTLARLRRWSTLGGGWKHLQHHPSRNLHGRFVAYGDWDRRYRPVEVREAVADIFVRGLAPSETVEYQKMVRWVDAGNLGWTRGCRTREDVDAYFADLVRVYGAIRDDGYRTQTELGNSGADEIRICIDREGRPCLFGGGTHRLSIALLLDVERVPVVVKRVHGIWLRTCLTRYRTDDAVHAFSLYLDDLGDSAGDDRCLAEGEAAS